MMKPRLNRLNRLSLQQALYNSSCEVQCITLRGMLPGRDDSSSSVDSGTDQDFSADSQILPVFFFPDETCSVARAGAQCSCSPSPTGAQCCKSPLRQCSAPAASCCCASASPKERYNSSSSLQCRSASPQYNNPSPVGGYSNGDSIEELYNTTPNRSTYTDPLAGHRAQYDALTANRFDEMSECNRSSVSYDAVFVDEGEVLSSSEEDDSTFVEDSLFYEEVEEVEEEELLPMEAEIKSDEDENMVGSTSHRMLALWGLLFVILAFRAVLCGWHLYMLQESGKPGRYFRELVNCLVCLTEAVS